MGKNRKPATTRRTKKAQHNTSNSWKTPQTIISTIMAVTSILSAGIAFHSLTEAQSASEQAKTMASAINNVSRSMSIQTDIMKKRLIVDSSESRAYITKEGIKIRPIFKHGQKIGWDVNPVFANTGKRNAINVKNI